MCVCVCVCVVMGQHRLPGVITPALKQTLTEHKLAALFIISCKWLLWMLSTMKASSQFRVQELCGSRDGCPGLPVPDISYGLCGRKATFEQEETAMVYMYVHGSTHHYDKPEVGSVDIKPNERNSLPPVYWNYRPHMPLGRLAHVAGATTVERRKQQLL